MRETSRNKRQATSRLSVAEAQGCLSKTIERVARGSERVILEDRGEDVAAIISAEDFRLFQRLLPLLFERLLPLLEEYEDRRDTEVARQALSESDGRIPYEKVRGELDLT